MSSAWARDGRDGVSSCEGPIAAVPHPLRARRRLQQRLRRRQRLSGAIAATAAAARKLAAPSLRRKTREQGRIERSLMQHIRMNRQCSTRKYCKGCNGGESRDKEAKAAVERRNAAADGAASVRQRQTAASLRAQERVIGSVDRDGPLCSPRARPKLLASMTEKVARKDAPRWMM